MNKLHKNWLVAVLYLSLLIFGAQFVVIEDKYVLYNEITPIPANGELSRTVENTAKSGYSTSINHIAISCPNTCHIQFSFLDESKTLFNEIILNQGPNAQGRHYDRHSDEWLPQSAGIFTIHIENLNTTATEVFVETGYINYFSKDPMVVLSIAACVLYFLLPNMFGDPRRLVKSENKYFGSLYLSYAIASAGLLWMFSISLINNSYNQFDGFTLTVMASMSVIMLAEGIYTFSMHVSPRFIANSFMVVTFLAIPTILIWTTFFDNFRFRDDPIVLLVIYIFFGYIIAFPAITVLSALSGAIFEKRFRNNRLQPEYQES